MEPINDQNIRDIEEEQRLLEQEAAEQQAIEAQQAQQAPQAPQQLQQLSQPQSGQQPMGSTPPPVDHSSVADAALLAVDDLERQNQMAFVAREEEASRLTASLDEADRFEQNAQIASQMAIESQTFAEAQRMEAGLIADNHAQEEQYLGGQLSAAREEYNTLEVARVVNDPAVMEAAAPDMADALGVGLDDLTDEVNASAKAATDLFSGQYANDRIKEAELAEKCGLGSGGCSGGNKLGLSIASLLPIVIGAATGQLGKGLQMAGKAMGKAGASAGGKGGKGGKKGGLGGRTSRSRIPEVERIAIAEQKALGVRIDQIYKIEQIKNARADREADKTTKALTDKGLTLDNAMKSRKIVGTEIENDVARLELREKVKESQSEKALDPPTAAQAAAAGFALKMHDSHRVFNDLQAKGFVPTRSDYLLPNEAKSEDRQMYEHAVIQFGSSQLRDESGAAISDTEFFRIEEHYFPLPGEKAGKIQLKLRSRVIAIAAMEAKAGESGMAAVRQRMDALSKEVGVDFDTSGVTQEEMDKELDTLSRLVNGDPLEGEEGYEENPGQKADSADGEQGGNQEAEEEEEKPNPYADMTDEELQKRLDELMAGDEN